MAVKKGKQGSGDPMERAAAKARKRFNESKKKKDGFSNLKYGEIADGSYPARLVKARAGVTKKEDIYMSLDFVIRGGEYDGVQVDVYEDLSTDQKSDSMIRTIKRLDFEITDELDPTDIPKIVDALNKEPPDVMLKIANKTANAKGEAYDEPRAFVNVDKTIGDAEPAAKSKPAAKKSRGKK